MRRFAWIFTIIITAISFPSCFGQTMPFKVDPALFHPVVLQQPAGTFSFQPTSVVITKPAFTINKQPLEAFNSPVHYTAFFCKMELKTVNYLGVWIKVHAGDYDGYTGGCGYNRP